MHPVEVMVAFLMIFMKGIHNVLHSVSWREDEDRTDKIDILYRTMLNKINENYELFASRPVVLSATNTNDTTHAS